MRLALALLAATCATPALADAVTYRGTIGAREAIIELTEPSHGAVIGRFAFLDTGKAVPLNAVAQDDDQFSLSEEGTRTEALCSFDDQGVASGVPATAEWTLTLDGTTLTGTRNGVDKTKSQTVTAQEIGRRPFECDATPLAFRDNAIDAVYATEGPIDPDRAPFELALTDVPLVEQSKLSVGDAEVAMMVDSRTVFAFPRIVSFADGRDPAPHNAVLDDAHKRTSISAFDCLASGYVGFGAGQYSFGPGSLGDYDGETIALSYAGQRLLSWTEAGSLYCGGAHPYNHFNSYTYDVETQKPLDLSLIFSGWQAFSYGEETPADPEVARANPDDHFWRPDDTLVAFVRERIPADVLFDDAEMDEICFGQDALREQLDIRFAPGPDAVFTLSGFPHVSSVCNGDLVTVPLAELDDFLTSEATSYFPELD